ncbi:helix-turn-helix transcriptional regulator [Haliea salexigens]|uniref:helix-turn-helix transcriptional regulator n=1 Tax=Haliea salexigens TaxID=287487 RepID=UPI0039E51A80
MQSSSYLSDTAIALRFQVSRATVWRWSHSANFPKPIKLSVGCTRWRVTEIEAWEQARCTQSASR